MEVSRRSFLGAFSRAVGVVTTSPTVQFVIQKPIVQAAINHRYTKVLVENGVAYSIGSSAGYVIGGAEPLRRTYFSPDRKSKSLLPTWGEVALATTASLGISKVCGVATVLVSLGWKRWRNKDAVAPQEPEVS